MIKIQQAQAPASYITWKNTPGADIRQGMTEPAYSELKTALMESHFGLCAYCQRVKPLHKIEHHCEYSICNGENGRPDWRNEIRNFLSVCSGKATHHHKEVQFCDTMKAERSVRHLLPIEFDPRKKAHINLISYRPTGLIKSANARHDQEINEVLNLNSPPLKEKRSILIKQLLKASKQRSGAYNPKKLLQLSLEYQVKEHGKYRRDFPGMYHYYAQQAIQKGAK